MFEINAHFQDLNQRPTQVSLETNYEFKTAQCWSHRLVGTNLDCTESSRFVIRFVLQSTGWCVKTWFADLETALTEPIRTRLTLILKNNTDFETRHKDFLNRFFLGDRIFKSC